jgi:hypothetical protein
MAKNSVRTSASVAKTASKVLKDGRYSNTARSVAASALSNRNSKSR